MRALRFPVLLFVYLGGLTLLLSTALRPSYDAVSVWLSVFTARTVSGLMGLVVDTTSKGVFVSYDGFMVEIIGECVGIYEAIIFIACVLAYPAPWQAKAKGLPLGIAVIFVFNLVRIMGLLVVGRHQPEMFEFFHLYFWQGTLVLIVAVVWLAWLHLFVRR